AVQYHRVRAARGEAARIAVAAAALATLLREVARNLDRARSERLRVAATEVRVAADAQQARRFGHAKLRSSLDTKVAADVQLVRSDVEQRRVAGDGYATARLRVAAQRCSTAHDQHAVVEAALDGLVGAVEPGRVRRER